MGNAPSTSASAGDALRNKKQLKQQQQNQQQKQKQKQKQTGGRPSNGDILQPPPAWNTNPDNTDEFLQVSPSSDISNPSQFRDRYRQRAEQQEAEQQQEQQEHDRHPSHTHHRRASKVIVVGKMQPPPALPRTAIVQDGGGKENKQDSNDPNNMTKRLARPSLSGPPIPLQFYFPAPGDQNNPNDREIDPPPLPPVMVHKQRKKDRHSSTSRHAVGVGVHNHKNKNKNSDRLSGARHRHSTSRLKLRQNSNKQLQKLGQKAVVAKHLLTSCWDESRHAATGCLQTANHGHGHGHGLDESDQHVILLQSQSRESVSTAANNHNHNRSHNHTQLVSYKKAKNQQEQEQQLEGHLQQQQQQQQQQLHPLATVSVPTNSANFNFVPAWNEHSMLSVSNDQHINLSLAEVDNAEHADEQQTTANASATANLHAEVLEQDYWDRMLSHAPESTPEKSSAEQSSSASPSALVVMYGVKAHGKHPVDSSDYDGTVANNNNNANNNLNESNSDNVKTKTPMPHIPAAASTFSSATGAVVPFPSAVPSPVQALFSVYGDDDNHNDENIDMNVNVKKEHVQVSKHEDMVEEQAAKMRHRQERERGRSSPTVVSQPTRRISGRGRDLEVEELVFGNDSQRQGRSQSQGRDSASTGSGARSSLGSTTRVERLRQQHREGLESQRLAAETIKVQEAMAAAVATAAVASSGTTSAKITTTAESKPAQREREITRGRSKSTATATAKSSVPANKSRGRSMTTAKTTNAPRARESVSQKPRRALSVYVPEPPKVKNTTTRVGTKKAAKTKPSRSSSVPPSTLRETLVKKIRKSTSSMGSNRNSSVNHKPKVRASHPSKRSSSVPAQSRASLPGLLQIAGWDNKPAATAEPVPAKPKVSNNVENKHKNLPVLLQLAGWDNSKTQQQQQQPAKNVPAPNAKSNRASTDKSDNAKVDFLTTKDEYIPKSVEFFGDSNFNKPRSAVTKTTMSIAMILQQTYPIAATCLRDEVDDNRMTTRRVSLEDDRSDTDIKAVKSAPSSMESGDYRKIATMDPERRSSPTGAANRMHRNLALQSPSEMSLQSNMSTNQSPGPPLSDQVLNNAAFLFSPSYVGGEANMRLHAPAPHTDVSSCALSTFDSRSRLSSRSQAVTIPISTSTSLAEPSKEGSVSDRHVRFSSDNEVIAISARKGESESIGASTLVNRESQEFVIPAIESKFSDLTDCTGTGRESIFSITENALLDVSETAMSSTSVESQKASISPEHLAAKDITVSSNEEPEIYEDTEKDDSLPNAPIMHWSYRDDHGVTPLRSGGNTTHATNSPFLRFQDAKNTFSQNLRFSDAENTFSTRKPKEVPVKKSSPIKPKPPVGSLVNSRIAAMEGHSRSTTLARPASRKMRRETTGHKVIAPRHGTLVSPHFRRDNSSRSIAMSNVQAGVHPKSPESRIATEPKLEDSPFDEKKQDVTPNSPMLIAGQVVESPPKQEKHQFNDSLSASSNESISDGDSENLQPIPTAGTFESSDDDETARGLLSDLLMAHQTALEEDSEASSAFFGDEEEDEFAAMLNYEDSESEGEDETVSTIRQDKASLGPLTSHRLSYGASVASSAASTIATVRQRRLSSIGTAPSSSMVPQRQPSIASIGESTTLPSTMVTKSTTVLPFRDEAPVKPTEQNHRAPPGALCLSPMQRTPMQARKWRALAVAAQEKDSKKQSNRGKKSLSERSINVIR